MSYASNNIAQLSPIDYTVDNSQVNEGADQNMDYYNQVLSNETLVPTDNTPMKRKCTENEKLSQFVIKENDIYSCNIKGCMLFNPQKSWHRLKEHLYQFHADKLVEAGINIDDKDRKTDDNKKLKLRKEPPSKRTRLPMDYFRNFCKKDEETGNYSCTVPNCKDFHPQKSSTRLKQHLILFHERYLIENGIKEETMRELKENISSVLSKEEEKKNNHRNNNNNNNNVINGNNNSNNSNGKYKKSKYAGVGAPLTKMILACDLPFKLIDNNYFIEFLRTSTNNSDIYTRIMKDRIFDLHLLDCYNMIKIKQSKMIEESQNGFISVNIFELPYDRKIIVLFFHSNSCGKIMLCAKSQICVSLEPKKLEDIIKYTIEEWSLLVSSLKDKICGYRINNMKYYNTLLECSKNLGFRYLLDEDVMESNNNNNNTNTNSNNNNNNNNNNNMKMIISSLFVINDYASVLKKIFSISIGEGSNAMFLINNMIIRDKTKYSELLHKINKYRMLFRQLITSFNLIYDNIGFIKDQKECKKFPEISVYNPTDLWYERIEILLQYKEERNMRIEIYKKLYEGSENINYEIEKLLNSMELYDDNFYNFYENILNVFKPYQEMILKMNSDMKYDLSNFFVDLVSCRNNNSHKRMMNNGDDDEDSNIYYSLFDDIFCYYESYFQYDYLTLAYLLDPTVVNPIQQMETNHLKINTNDPIEFVVESNNMKKVISDESNFKGYLTEFVHNKKAIIIANENSVENKALWFKSENNNNNDFYKLGNILFSFNMHEDFRGKNISFDFINEDERLKESEFLNRYIMCKENVELIDILDGKQLNNTYDKMPVPSSSYSV